MKTLAIDGGAPVRTLPFAPWPVFEREELEATSQVLRSGLVNYWTGEQGRLFEREFAVSIGIEHAVAVANGTVSLELALAALGIGPGDEVIVPCRTFIATASCVVMRGAVPVVADVDPASQNITAQTIKAILTPNTKAIIVVHLAGWPCDMVSITRLAREKGLYVIEDCAQAQGAKYKGVPVGAWGDAASFSFCQDKIMTTGGEGGMLVTGNREIWSRAWSYKDHGKNYDTVYKRQHPPGFRWLHEFFGTNWRLTEMQAAIGRVMLKKIPFWLETRRKNAAVLAKCIRGIPGLNVYTPGPDAEHAYYKFYAFVKPQELKTGWDRNRLMAAICAEGIPCFSGSCSEIYKEKAFVKAGLSPRQPLKTARELGETSLMFLVHPTLSEKDMYDTCAAIKKVMHHALK